jgi:AraC-like DNA-binding protein
MLIATEDLSAFHFSTEDVPRRGRLARYRELFSSKLVKFDLRAADGEPRCLARWRSFSEGVLAVCIASSPIRASWKHFARYDDGFALAMFRAGPAQVSHCGREVDVARGSAVVLSGADPVAMMRTDYSYFSFPRAALAPLVADLDGAFMSVIPAGSEALRLLAGYADLMTGTAEAMSPELSRLAGTHVCDLAALALGVRRDAAEVAKGRGLRAARLQAIVADIERNLGARNVRPAVLAARHRVTPRYVHKLFEAEGTTLSRYVLGRRLARVHRMLTDPRYAACAIGGVAYDAGFGDLSTFNREFRRRYGATPSDVRAGARNCAASAWDSVRS